ncbi:MAG: tyrosine-type recombinase/integrase [Planctomycetota bacterium]
MASLSSNAAKGFTVYIKRPNGKRYPVRLGKIGKRRAEGVRGHLHELEQSTLRGIAPPPDTRQWADGITGEFRRKLALAGLVEARSTESLSGLIELLREKKSGTVKQSTMEKAEQAWSSMLRCWGDQRRLDSLTLGDGDDLVDSLRAQGLANGTIHKRISDCRSGLEWAVRRRLLAFNPLDGLRLPSAPDASRVRYIDADDCRRIMEYLPTAELRLAFAMGRWGGLRINSELIGMRWEHIDIHRERITVLSPKTEHHEGRESRTVPLFTELVEPVREAFELASEREPWIFPWVRGVSAMALRKRVHDAIQAAGLKKWPKLWTNLRSTRETELADYMPEHVVCGIIGNSPKVARKHYLQVTEDHLDQAIRGGGSGAPSGAPPASAHAHGAPGKG